jgi:cell division protein FtsQ
VWGVYWARNKAQAQVCKSIKVVVENTEQTSFVTPQGITSDLQKMNFKIVGLPMWQINSDSIEKALSKSSFLESAQCIKGQDGVFEIRVKQLIPVLRVFDGDDSYYVNREGKKIPASTNFFTDVPIVEGHFSKGFGPEKLLPMVDYVSADSTLASIVTMYKYRDPMNIYVVPCFNGHIVNMGSVDNYQSKFRKLLLFYRKVMPEKGWNTYDTISVKWDHQVVATLAKKKVVPTFTYDSEDEDPADDIETMTTSDTQGTATSSKKTEEKKPAENEKKQNENNNTEKKNNNNN